MIIKYDHKAFSNSDHTFFFMKNMMNKLMQEI